MLGVDTQHPRLNFLLSFSMNYDFGNFIKNTRMTNLLINMKYFFFWLLIVLLIVVFMVLIYKNFIYRN
ncbi:hypothetical protein EGC27_23195 [Escherichia coli]|nr:hypothetical protein [Escherichia coli]EFN7746754.1 hypothetical protein [Escherichia coli]